MSDSFYAIKPERFSSRTEIRPVIQKKLLIITFTEFIYTSEILDLWYDNVSLLVRRWIRHMMEGEPGEMGIARGPNALQELVLICGKETDPMKCERGTIRREFGWENPILLADGYSYFGNVIHRPKNPEELKRDLAIARQFLKF